MITGVRSNPWLVFPSPNSHAKLRLFCFPYAGGGAHVFHEWGKRLPGMIELCAIQLPGRGMRWKERPCSHLMPLVDMVSHAILPWLDKPFALFGHSMGALISFELMRTLRVRNGAQSVYFFASGRPAPHLPNKGPVVHTMPDGELLEHLRKLSGTPSALLGNVELMKMMFPVLRADFSMCETYTCKKEPPLDSRISALGGLDDSDVSPDELAAWSEHTTGDFSLRMFPGDHFFIHTVQSQVLDAISEKLESVLV